MITEIDTENIIYRDAALFGIKRYRTPNLDRGDVTEERLTVTAKKQSKERYWIKNFVELNLCVPDVDNQQNILRLNELERMAVAQMQATGLYDGTRYTYEVDSTEKFQNRDLKISYLNVRILFSILNIKQ